MNISIIVAAARNGAIGLENELLWHLPDDFRRFKKMTSGHPVVMGRKTFESLGRPLPRRSNIVISRHPDFSPEGAVRVDSLEAALALAEEAPGSGEIFVIGGGEIYRQAFPLVSRIYLTEVHAELEGDTYFEIPDPSQWEVVRRELHPADERHLYSFEYLDMVRK